MKKSSFTCEMFSAESILRQNKMTPESHKNLPGPVPEIKKFLLDSLAGVSKKRTFTPFDNILREE